MPRLPTFIVVTTVATFSLAPSTPKAAPPPAANPASVWVSADGNDRTGCGSIGSPCRTLQYAHDNVVQDFGEIVVKGDGDYGALTITKSISVFSSGASAVVMRMQQGTSAISINAGQNATIYLRGLTVIGNPGALVTQHGVEFDGGARLIVANCTFTNFNGAGILIQPGNSMTFSISKTDLQNNAASGIALSAGTTRGTVTGVRIGGAGLGYGIFVNPNSSVLVSDTTVSNTSNGVYNNGGTVRLTRLIATGNQTGVNVSSGTTYTYGDNRIDGNGTDVNGSLTPTPSK